MDTGLRKKDRFDGECGCSTCRRELDGTCPAGYRAKPEEMICGYYKIITPACEREKGEENGI